MEYSSKNIERFKWPVAVSRKMDFTPQRIWEAITRPGNLNDCHPFCKKNIVHEWPGIGSRDVIHYYSGWVLQREFVNWMESTGYDLLIGREGGRKSYVSWRISEESDGAGRLRIAIYPHNLQNIPLVVRWIPQVTIVQPQLHRYLESVLKGFEWFITQGKPVVKDQFGSHKWFSTIGK